MVTIAFMVISNCDFKMYVFVQVTSLLTKTHDAEHFITGLKQQFTQSQNELHDHTVRNFLSTHSYNQGSKLAPSDPLRGPTFWEG